jgi:polysaccharide deacetylase 2 family uncharacterized protein YibQ
MDRGILIRRLVPLARRHAGDGAFVVSLALGLWLGGAAAWAGLNELIASVPGMEAEAAGRPPAHLAVTGFAPSAYQPQLLYPVRSNPFPNWLTAPPPSYHGPVIAIVIDDLGEDLAGTDRAIALPQEVALSFLPYADGSVFLAGEAKRKGHQILAHVPMEALSRIDPGPMALRTGAPDIAARLAWNIARVPGLSGINNHEGSKFTADAASLAPVARLLAARHLFFFDSRTGPDSKVVPVAHQWGVMSAGRDVFLDDDQSPAAVRAQLERLVATAKAQGVAIAIGHPHDMTLSILSGWLRQNHGVTLIPLSDAIRLKSEREVLAAR